MRGLAAARSEPVYDHLVKRRAASGGFSTIFHYYAEKIQRTTSTNPWA